MRNGSPHARDPIFEKAEEIFCAVMEIEGVNERRAFLEQACREDARLRFEVEQMLAAQPEVERIFHETEPALRQEEIVVQAIVADPLVRESVGLKPTSDEKLGMCIGRYKLLKVIGKGGCGVVYLAAQEKPVRRQVALKVIKLGMDTESVIARFESERQALAMMDHPNIARVFDAGATDGGRPYFVMELVQGSRITEYCDQHRLSIPERLDLFVQVCHAIQHAHQKGTIHRDIKPSNILVGVHDSVPTLKVIDFGIAKSTEVRLADTSLFTACGQLIGTPAYMSPEQAELRAFDIDTRSDIYSLGVLLYELLSGRTPFDPPELVESGLDEMRRILRETEPPRPTVRLESLRADELVAVAKLRRIEPGKLRSVLSGDLDWIVMKALEKDRDRRYGTANGLAADILRHRNNEAVLARPPSRTYRLQKLVRRNRAVFVAGFLVMLALSAGFGVSAWMFLREKEARRDAERARANETLLRAQAEIREKITRATVLLSRGEMAAADELVAPLPDSLCPPYMEQVRVYRTLADWNALERRWPEAARRAQTTVRLNRVDVMDQSGAVTCDYMSAAAALLAVGEIDLYLELCSESRMRFVTTTSAVAAEQIIKVNLLLPQSPEVLVELEPLVEVAVTSFTGQTLLQPTTVEAWCLMAIALNEYRRGRWERAEEFANAALWPDDAPARTATTQIILAMSIYRMGRIEESRQLLEDGRKLIDARFTKPLNATAMDTWYSWVMARVLLQEATSLIAGASPNAG